MQNRQTIMDAKDVRHLTKDILRMTVGLDSLKVVQDVQLALEVLENEAIEKLDYWLSIKDK